MGVYVIYSSELYHHGIKGQKWGVRRYQNPDGSYTTEGLKRYGRQTNRILNKYGDNEHTRKAIQYRNLEREKDYYDRMEESPSDKRLFKDYERARKNPTDDNIEELLKTVGTRDQILKMRREVIKQQGKKHLDDDEVAKHVYKKISDFGNNFTLAGMVAGGTLGLAGGVAGIVAAGMGLATVLDAPVMVPVGAFGASGAIFGAAGLGVLGQKIDSKIADKKINEVSVYKKYKEVRNRADNGNKLSKSKRAKDIEYMREKVTKYDTPEKFKDSLFCDNFTDWVLDSIWDD
jgi:hypothetical protein